MKSPWWMLMIMVAGGAVWAGPAMDVESCVRAARAGSPDVRALQARVAAARSAVDQAASAYYPQIGLGAGYARTDNPAQSFMMDLNRRALNMADPAFNPNEPEDTENTRLSIHARYALYDGGRRGLTKASAEAAASAAAAQERVVRNALVHEVRRAWYGVRQAAALVRLGEDTVASMKENVRVAGERVQAGQALQTDVLNLEVSLAEAEEQLIRARNGVELAVLALNTAIGQDYATAEGVLAVALPADPSTPAGDENQIEQRPELAAARAALEAQENQYRLARRGYAPQVSAFGSVDWDSEVNTDFEQSYFAGVGAEWELFTGFRRGAAVAAAAQAREAARADLQSLHNRLALDYRSAVLSTREAAQRLDVSQRSRKNAEEALRITRARYTEGSADVTELLTAQNGLTATRAREESARYDLWTALSNVERAAGRLADEPPTPSPL